MYFDLLSVVSGSNEPNSMVGFFTNCKLYSECSLRDEDPERHREKSFSLPDLDMGWVGKKWLDYIVLW